MAKAFLDLASGYQGLQPAHVATMQIALPSESYSDGQKESAFFDQFLREAGALPGVESVGLADNIPASNIDNSRHLSQFADALRCEKASFPPPTWKASARIFFPL
jgi:hypothetical protein